MLLVSACMWGKPTRYDGRHSLSVELRELLAGQPLLLACPEVMGGLAVPRPAARFVGASFGREGQDVLAGRARLLTSTGRDCSQDFINGATQVLELARSQGVVMAYLKDRSPSCAYDPQGINPRGGPGQGVLTALLLQSGITVREVRSRSQA